MAEIPLQRGAETRDAEDELVCSESVRHHRQQRSNCYFEVNRAWERRM